jgi:hypothetical protein
MTSDAVFLNYINACLLNANYLRLGPGSENGCMTQPVLSLEQILPEEIVLRYVTVVANGCLPVAAVHPRCILGKHYMAVDAGLGIIGKI